MCNRPLLYIYLQGEPENYIYIPTWYNVYQTTDYIFLQGVMCTRYCIYIPRGCNVYQTTVYIYIFLQGEPDICICTYSYRVNQTTVYVFLQGKQDNSIYIPTGYIIYQTTLYIFLQGLMCTRQLFIYSYRVNQTSVYIYSYRV